MQSNGTNEYAFEGALVSTERLAQHLGDLGMRLVEVSVDTDDYDSDHILGAVGWRWKHDTQESMRRHIPAHVAFEQLMSRAGIANDTTVVLYGDMDNWFAAYACWLLKYYGHHDVRLLNGGRKKWLAEGRELTTDVPHYAPSDYRVVARATNLRALRDNVVDHIGRQGAALVDVRSPDEFAGKLLAPANLPQEGAQRGGHIPGAANIPWS